LTIAASISSITEQRTTVTVMIHLRAPTSAMESQSVAIVAFTFMPIRSG
jgi:hypothetical protein